MMSEWLGPFVTTPLSVPTTQKSFQGVKHYIGKDNSLGDVVKKGPLISSVGIRFCELTREYGR